MRAETGRSGACSSEIPVRRVYARFGTFRSDRKAAQKFPETCVSNAFTSASGSGRGCLAPSVQIMLGFPQKIRGLPELRGLSSASAPYSREQPWLYAVGVVAIRDNRNGNFRLTA